MSSIPRTLVALGGLSLAAGAGANNFDPYNVLPVVSLASFVAAFGLQRMYTPPVEPASSPWFQENCPPENMSPRCQVFTVLKNTVGTDDNRIPWNSTFGPEDSSHLSGIKDTDLSRSVMWGTTPDGLPFVAAKYTANKVQNCTVALFLPGPKEPLNAFVEPSNCTFFDPRMTNELLFANSWAALLEGQPVEVQVGKDVATLQLGFSAPALEEQVEDQKPTPEPKKADEAPTPSPEQQNPEPQVANGISIQEKQNPEPQVANGTPTPEKQNPEPQVANGISIQEKQNPEPQVPNGTSTRAPTHKQAKQPTQNPVARNLTASTTQTPKPTPKTGVQVADNSTRIADQLKNPNGLTKE